MWRIFRVLTVPCFLLALAPAGLHAADTQCQRFALPDTAGKHCMTSADSHVSGAKCEKASATVSGYMFGDLYWEAANHSDALKNQNGLWFRRIFLTYDKKLCQDFAMRLRLEAASPGLPSIEASDRMKPFLKDASLKWTRGRHSVLFGLVPTPTWERVEAGWGYRSVEKTPVDLARLGGSRDFGVAIQGTIGEGKKLNYTALAGTGTETRSETDKDKKLYLALSTSPASGVNVEAYADWENRTGDQDILTLQGFATYERARYKMGAQFVQQTRKHAVGSEDLRLEIASVFAIHKCSDRVSGIVRFDKAFDSMPGTDINAYMPFADGHKWGLLIAGVDLRPIQDVHLIPNVEVVTYDKVGGVRPGTDVVPRVTVHYTF